MKRILCFLIVMCAVSCGSALADITVLYANPPSGSVGGTIGVDPPLASYSDTDLINASSPLSGSVSYNGAEYAFLSSEVGLYYAKAHVIAPTLINCNSRTEATVYFMVDGGQLSLSWNVEVGGESPYLDFGGYSGCFVEVTDWTNGTEILGIAPDVWDPISGTQTVTLYPTHVYRLYWNFNLWHSGGGWGASDFWAQLTLNLEDRVEMPNVCGMNEAEAETTLIASRLIKGTVTYDYSDTVPAGLVISQDPVAGTVVDDGSAVNIVISEGSMPVVVIVDVVADSITTTTKSITCNIWPPSGYDVTQINAGSILLNGEIPPVQISVRSKQQMLVVKFPTSELSLVPGTLELTISGELTDGTPFAGSDSVVVVKKGGKPN